MALDDDIRVLSGVGLFRGLAEEHLRLLAFGADTIRFDAGETLYREGEPALSAYIVLSGRIELSKVVGRERRRIGDVSPGATLGELALIAPTHRMTDAVAAVDTRVMSLDRKIFRRILEEYPGVARRLHRQLAEEFQAMVRQLERIAPSAEE